MQILILPIQRTNGANKNSVPTHLREHLNFFKCPRRTMHLKKKRQNLPKIGHVVTLTKISTVVVVEKA